MTATKREIKVLLLHVERYEKEWPTTGAVEFCAWLWGKISDIPQPFRETATINIGTTTVDGIDYATITIHYTRPETDEELAARIAEAELRVKIRETQERRQLEILKAKYEKSEGK